MKRFVTITAAVVVANVSMAWIAPHATADPRTAFHGAPLVRRNVVELTTKERRAFVRAVKLLKETPSPYDARFNYYDQFVEWHLSLYRCGGLDFDATVGHGGSFFLPWHRVFVRLFEQALRDVSGRAIAVPYWDWSSPESVASVFSDDFMGGDGDPNTGYAVTTGPFRAGAWTITLAPENQPWAASYKPHLVRRFGSGTSPAPGGGPLFPLPPVTDVQWALSAPAYDAAPYDMSADPNQSFRNAIEGWWRALPNGTRYADPLDHQHCGPDGTAQVTRDGGSLHNRVHSWVGGVGNEVTSQTIFGTMLMPNSPSDPVFFLHHANIDRLWAKWQASHPQASFEPAALAATPMRPFGDGAGRYTPSSTWNIEDLAYQYSDYDDSDDVSPAASIAAGPSAGASPASYTCELVA